MKQTMACYITSQKAWSFELALFLQCQRSYAKLIYAFDLNVPNHIKKFVVM